MVLDIVVVPLRSTFAQYVPLHYGRNFPTHAVAVQASVSHGKIIKCTKLINIYVGCIL